MENMFGRMRIQNTPFETIEMLIDAYPGNIVITCPYGIQLPAASCRLLFWGIGESHRLLLQNVPVDAQKKDSQGITPLRRLFRRTIDLPVKHQLNSWNFFSTAVPRV
jgi:hypothetical protein